MNPAELRTLLDEVQSGALKPDLAYRACSNISVTCRSKTWASHVSTITARSARAFQRSSLAPARPPVQVAGIAARIVAAGQTLLVTRTDSAAYAAVREVVPGAIFHPDARLITFQQGHGPSGRGVILVAAAGTSDLPVAEEAALTAELMRNQVERLYDVGVAGVHRVIAERSRFAAARVIVVSPAWKVPCRASWAAS